MRGTDKITDKLNRFIGFKNPNSGYIGLYTNNLVQVGDKIGIKAHATVDDVWSDTIEIEVVATPVTKVTVNADTARNDIQLGKTLQMFAFLHSSNATKQNVLWQIVKGEQYASIDRPR